MRRSRSATPHNQFNQVKRADCSRLPGVEARWSMSSCVFAERTEPRLLLAFDGVALAIHTLLGKVCVDRMLEERHRSSSSLRIPAERLAAAHQCA